MKSQLLKLGLAAFFVFLLAAAVPASASKPDNKGEERENHKVMMETREHEGKKENERKGHDEEKHEENKKMKEHEKEGKREDKREKHEEKREENHERNDEKHEKGEEKREMKNEKHEEKREEKRERNEEKCDEKHERRGEKCEEKREKREEKHVCKETRCREKEKHEVRRVERNDNFNCGMRKECGRRPVEVIVVPFARKTCNNGCREERDRDRSSWEREMVNDACGCERRNMNHNCGLNHHLCQRHHRKHNHHRCMTFSMEWVRMHNMCRRI